MFEEQLEEDQQSSRRGTIILISIVIVLAIVGTLAYFVSKGAFSSSSATAASAAPVVKGDPVKDLHFISEPTMVKDDAGTAAWLVDVRERVANAHVQPHQVSHHLRRPEPKRDRPE